MWSPDGRDVLYIGARPDGGRELYRVSASGGTPRALGAGTGSDISFADLSPDGSQVAYASFPGGWGFLEVIPAAGGTPRRLTTATERVYHLAPVWSPDGSRIALMDYDYPGDTYDVGLVTWPGGEWTRLTRTPAVTEGGPEWTPDGRSFVFVHNTIVSRVVVVPVAELLAPRP
jgi:Tol biopolymer transport system component